MAGSNLPLNQLTPGQDARIEAIDVEMPASLRARVMSLGFVPGSIVRVIRKAPLGDPIEYEVRGGRVSLRKTESKFLSVAQ